MCIHDTSILCFRPRNSALVFYRFSLYPGPILNLVYWALGLTLTLLSWNHCTFWLWPLSVILHVALTRSEHRSSVITACYGDWWGCGTGLHFPALDFFPSQTQQYLGIVYSWVFKLTFKHQSLLNNTGKFSNVSRVPKFWMFCRRISLVFWGIKQRK